MNPVPIYKLSKDDRIFKVSNPNIVARNASKYFINVYRSNKPTKKYMVKNGTGKWIHFGDVQYADYTKHQDEDRRNKFLKRNARWAKEFPLTSAWLSYYLLW